MKRNFQKRWKKILKVSFILFLTLSWILTGRPRTPFFNFPPKIHEAQATAAQGLYCEKTTDTTATSASWVDVCEISAASFTAGKKYLIIVNVYLSHASSANEAKARVVHGTTPTEFTDSAAAYELTLASDTAGNRTAYGYMTVWDQPATAELIKIQITGSSTTVVTAEMGQIFALKLSDDFTENTDWCFTEVTTDYSTETAFSDTSTTDAASCSLTANGTDNYLAIANAMVDVAATTSNYMMSLYESVANTDEPSIDIEGEDATNEFRSHLLARTYTPTAAAHTWQPRFNDEATTHIIMSSRIFVLRLNKFAQHSTSYLADLESPAATPTWTTTRTLGVTPAVTGDWFILGSFTNDVSTITDDLFTRLQVNNGGGLASDPSYGDDAPHEDSWDPTDVTPFQIFKMRSLSSGAERTINLDVQLNSGTGLQVRQRHLVAFSLELASLSPVLTQNDYEIFVDNDALTPADEWPSGSLATGENGAVTALPVAYDPFDPADEVRIRMNIAITNATLDASSEGFILQYKETNSCTDGTSWTDVDATAGGGTWRFASSTVADNTTLTTLKISTSNVAGRYSKSDPTSTNPNSVSAGQNLEWDWHLEYNGDAAAHTFCFRMINDAGAALNAYNSDSYPMIDTRPGINNLLRHGEFFSSGSGKGFFWAD